MRSTRGGGQEKPPEFRWRGRPKILAGFGLTELGPGDLGKRAGSESTTSCYAASRSAAVGVCTRRYPAELRRHVLQHAISNPSVQTSS